MLNEAYLKRLGRYGDTFAERVQGAREDAFARYLERSTYRVEFEDTLNDVNVVGALEPRKQDETETTQWLLVDLSHQWDAGTLFWINNKCWMIWWKRETESKGYNKYCVLKMSHWIKWRDRQGKMHESPGYFYGKMDRIIYDVVRGTSSAPNYQEPNKETHIIMPKTLDLKREDYLEIDGEGFLVTGYDLSSAPGVAYFSLTETYIHDTTPPIRDQDTDTFWLNGGNKS